VSGDRTALLRAADGASWTYTQLDDDVERTAGRLAALGVGAGDHVGLLAGTDVAAVRTIYAALRLGAVAVPLHPRLTAEELGPQVDVADLDVLAAEGQSASLAVEATARAERDPILAVLETGQADGNRDDEGVAGPVQPANPAQSLRPDQAGDERQRDDGRAAPIALGERAPTAFDAPVPDLDDPRLFVFTSGTTGEPKAVVLTAGNLRSSAVASGYRLGIDPDDRWFDPLSIAHMGGIAPVDRSVRYGTTVVLQRTFDADGTLAAIDERDASCLSLVPTMLRRLLEADDSGALQTLRFVLSGGAATPPELVDRCADLDVPVCPTYGATEACSQVATARPEEARAYEGTVGRPLLPTTVRIVDGPADDDGPAELPAGEVGEIVVDGPTVSPGYYGDGAATAANRSALGYHTGDLGRLDDGGRLWVLGRADERISTGGELVTPGDVETVLESHPRIDAAAVVGLEDPEWGERVGAMVAADALDPAAIAEHCEGRLAGYKRPRTVAVVESLPRTASGTVDRPAVRDRLAAEGVEC